MATRVHDLDDHELMSSLDWNREVVVRKLAGLTREQATAVTTPSGVTLLGIVQHLAWVERHWFEHCFSGEPEEDSDATRSFQLLPTATVEAVLDDYRAACESSRRVASAAASFEVRTTNAHWYFGIVTLRWIFLHMIRETARHAGHLDILRELTDGHTGDH